MEGKQGLLDVWEGCAIAQPAYFSSLLMDFAAQVALVWNKAAEARFAEIYTFVLQSSVDEVQLVIQFLKNLYFAHQMKTVSEGALEVRLLNLVLLEILAYLRMAPQAQEVKEVLGEVLVPYLKAVQVGVLADLGVDLCER